MEQIQDLPDIVKEELSDDYMRDIKNHLEKRRAHELGSEKYNNINDEIAWLSGLLIKCIE